MKARLQRQPQPSGRARRATRSCRRARASGGAGPRRRRARCWRRGICTPTSARAARCCGARRGARLARPPASRGRCRSTRPTRSTRRAGSRLRRRSSTRCAARSTTCAPRAPLDVPLRRQAGRAARQRADPDPRLLGRARAVQHHLDPPGRPGQLRPVHGLDVRDGGRIRRQGPPAGSSILSYSQSENPDSPYYADQTRLFSQEKWLPMRFTERESRPTRPTRSGW